MKIIKAKNNDGTIKEYAVILTYYDEEYNKDYVVYTDNKYNSNDELNIYINSYNKNNKEIISTPIEDKKEYTKIKTIINSILLTMKNEQDKLDSKE